MTDALMDRALVDDSGEPDPNLDALASRAVALLDRVPPPVTAAVVDALRALLAFVASLNRPALEAIPTLTSADVKQELQQIVAELSLYKMATGLPFGSLAAKFIGGAIAALPPDIAKAVFRPR